MSCRPNILTLWAKFGLWVGVWHFYGRVKTWTPSGPALFKKKKTTHTYIISKGLNNVGTSWKQPRRKCSFICNKLTQQHCRFTFFFCLQCRETHRGKLLPNMTEQKNTIWSETCLFVALWQRERESLKPAPLPWLRLAALRRRGVLKVTLSETMNSFVKLCRFLFQY